MRIHLIAVGERMPRWVQDGYAEYAKRLPRESTLQLVEIPSGYRAGNAYPQRAIAEEGERMLRALPRTAYTVALEAGGQLLSTEQLAMRLVKLAQSHGDLALLVGGPDGLAAACRARAEESWSLSPLTFPHLLVRIIVAEQLYRAYCIVQHHPYHR